MEEESGITFGEICHLIKKRIWWILAISVIVAVVAGLAVGLVLNRGKDDYSLTFMVEFPGVENGQYPDGSVFNYNSIVYADRLAAAKEAGVEGNADAFKDVDVEEMSANGDIAIVPETSESAVTTENTTGLTGAYVITVSSAYFKDKDEASDFLRAVLNETIGVVNEKIVGMDFTASLAGYENYTSYSAYGDRLAALAEQQQFLLTQYNAVIGGGSKISQNYGLFVYEGQTISALYNEAKVLGSTLSTLRAEYNDYGYVYLNGETDDFAALAGRWAGQVKSCQDELNAYKQQFDQAVISEGAYVQRVLELTERSKLLRAQIASIGYTYNDDGTVAPAADQAEKLQGNTTFGNEVNALWKTLVANSETAKNALVALYDAESQIVYRQSGVTVIENGTSTILVTVAGFVVAFLLASIIFCAADWPAYKKQRDAKSAPAEETLEREAAVSDDKE